MELNTVGKDIPLLLWRKEWNHAQTSKKPPNMFGVPISISFVKWNVDVKWRKLVKFLDLFTLYVETTYCYSSAS